MRVIETPRLRLSAIPAETARALVEGLPTPGWNFAAGYPSEFSLETMHVVLAHVGEDSGGPYFIVRRDDGTVVGEIGADLDRSTGTAQVGYSVVEPSWGRGYATEALRALLDELLADADVRCVVAETLFDHAASRRVMEKAGMVHRGGRTAVGDGETLELVVYAAVRTP